MDGVGVTIKNSVGNAMIAAESIPNVLVRCAAVVPILNLVDVEICHYDTSHIDKIKEILPGSKTLSIRCKKFGISKVYEIFFSKEQSQQILRKINSKDSKHTNAAFIIKSKACSALLQENNLMTKTCKAMMHLNQHWERMLLKAMRNLVLIKFL